MDTRSSPACAGDSLLPVGAADQPEDRWNDDGGRYESPSDDARQPDVASRVGLNVQDRKYC